jgi:predicted AAA+ superfamily ATPase
VVRVNPTPLGRLLARHAEEPVTEALTDTRVVLVTGARQSGKSTLVGLVAKGRDAEWRNLDTATTRQAAIADPAGFVDSGELMVIDEIQRVPELLLAIKEQVDSDPRPGRYLLTGSARVLGLRGLPDTLPGRTETIELWPLAQGEIDGTADRFVDAVFEHAEALAHESALTRQDYAERVVRGGWPVSSPGRGSAPSYFITAPKTKSRSTRSSRTARARSSASRSRPPRPSRPEIFAA